MIEFNTNDKKEAHATIDYLLQEIKRYGINLTIIFYTDKGQEDMLTIGIVNDEEFKPLLTGHYMYVGAYLTGVKDCAELL